MIPKAVLDQLEIPGVTCFPVQGGDINRSYCLHGNHATYFLKINKRQPCPGLFEKEATGLRKLAHAGTFRIPAPLKSGEAGPDQYLLLEWLDAHTPGPNSWELLGKGLATMHRSPQPFFGLEEHNYLAVWLQDNTPAETWSEFYSTRRILPLIRSLADAGKLDQRDQANADFFCRRLPDLFPEEPPALLHGDLWNGNLLFLRDGAPVLFDPAVYFGHREMDIGMTRLFGGFDISFYQAYHQTYPLQHGWQQRLPYTQLYPLLLHAWLFGGHYIRDVSSILASFS